MENGQVTLRAGALDDEARDAFAAVLAPGVDVTGGLQSVDDILSGCELFEWDRGGDIVARHALISRNYAHGAEGIIVAAVGRAPVPFVHSLAVMESQFIDVRAVRVHTRRMGMVKQLARCGYSVEGFILRKKIKRGTS